MEKQHKEDIEEGKNTNLSFNFNKLLNANFGPKKNTAVEEAGKCLNLSGNSWESLDFNYSINADTVLTFEYKSEQEPELSMIVFESNRKWPEALSYFKIHGSLFCKDSAFGKGPVYNGNGSWQRFSLPIGQYLKGRFTKIAFAIEDDSGKKKGDASFKNVEIHEKSQVINKTVMLFSKAIPKAFQEVLPKQNTSDKNGTEIEAVKTNPFLAHSTCKDKNPEHHKYTQLCASGIMPIQSSANDLFVESLIISGMTAGLSSSYKTLLEMLSVKASEKLIWTFEGNSQAFEYLSAGEVLTLNYSICSLDKKVTINVFGTETVPLILQEAFTTGQDSELQVENIFDCGSRDELVGLDDLSIDIKGSMQDEFKFQIDTEAGVFTFDPTQFSYLKENEILEFHFKLGSTEKPEEKAKELFSVVIVGHLKVQPSIVIIQNHIERKKLLTFLEFAVQESTGKVLRDELIVSTTQMGSLVFSIGECSLEIKQRSFTEPELEICDDSKLFTDSTKVDLKNYSEKEDADFLDCDLKVI